MQSSLHVSCEYPNVIVNRRYNRLPDDVKRQYSTLPDYWLVVPCGRCVLCKARLSREWKVRLTYEMQNTRTHRHNSRQVPRVVFLTFTFRDECYTNSEEIFAEWLVKFRDNYRKKYGRSPRYFAITDRGSQFARLHLHMLLIDPRMYDSRRKSFVGDVSISELKRHSFWWRYGFVDAQWVKYHSVANYVVGYITGANLNNEEPVKHGKPICKEALEYKPHIYVSKGLGSAVLTDDFIKYVQSRNLSTIDIDGYIYGLPRYYLDKVLDRMGQNAGPAMYYKCNDLRGQSKTINLIRDEFIFQRQAVNKAEQLDYYARNGFDVSTYIYDYKRHRLSASLLASTLSTTSQFLTPEKERLPGSVLDSSHSDFVGIIEYVPPEYGGLKKTYYCDYDLHYAPILNDCPF